MGTRGSIVVGGERYEVISGAHPRYTGRILRKILRKYKPRTKKEFIKLAKENGIDIAGKAPKNYGWPFEEYRYEVKLREGKVKTMVVKEPKNRKKKKDKGKKVMNAGHGKVEDGRYRRSDTGKEAHYSFKRDLKEHSKYLPAPGKPMTGDNKKILYNPENPGQHIVLAKYDREKGKWVPVNYGGKVTEARKVKKKYKHWKVGYV